MKFEPKKALVGIGAAFVLLTVWHDPQKAGDNTGNFLSDAQDWVSDAFDKANDFSQSVVD